MLIFIAIAFITLLSTVFEVKVEADSKYYGTVEFKKEYYHYEVTCRDNIIYYFDFDCLKDHPNETDQWRPASILSKEADNLLSSLTDEGIWIGGLRVNTGLRNYQWTWIGYDATDPNNNFAYTNESSDGSISGNCAEGKYCNFADGALNTLSVKCGSSNVFNKYLIITPKTNATTKVRQWAAIPHVSCSGANPPVPAAKCYTCLKIDDKPGPTTTVSTSQSNATTAISSPSSTIPFVTSSAITAYKVPLGFLLFGVLLLSFKHI